MSTSTQNGELVNRVQQIRLKNQLGADQGRGGGSSASWLPWILCLVMTLAWAGVGVRSYRAPTGSAVSDGPALNVATSTASSTSTTPTTAAAPVAAGTIELEVKGYIVPSQQIAVSPIEVAGRLVELNVVEGKLFKQGDVLARIEDVNYQSQYAEAIAALESSKQRYANVQQRLAVLMPNSVRKVEVTQVEEELKEAEAQGSRMADDVTRFERLGTSAADRELKQARFDLQGNEARVRRLQASLTLLKEGPRQEQKLAAEAEVKGAQADIQAAEARLKQARWRLENCTIRSPIDGTILSKKAELGNLVNPLAFSASSGSVCDIANLANLEVDLEIPEREIGKLRVGQKCRIRADAFSNRAYTGQLDRIMPIANRAKSIVIVRVKIDLPESETPGQYLKPEMGAVVSFLADERK